MAVFIVTYTIWFEQETRNKKLKCQARKKNHLINNYLLNK